MNQLVKVNNGIELSITSQQALKSLLPSERKIIEAGLSIKIRDLPSSEVVDEFVAIITNTLTRAGSKADDATLAIYADELYTVLMEKYPLVTVEEIREALKAGVYGEAGDYFGLNPKSFIQFVRHYLVRDERREAKIQFESKQKTLALSAPIILPADMLQDDMDYTDYQYSEHLKGGLISDFIDPCVFKVLEYTERFILTHEEKNVIKDRAESYLTRLKSSNKFQYTMKDLLAGFSSPKDSSALIKMISRQFAVYDFFEKCKAEGKKTIFK